MHTASLGRHVPQGINYQQFQCDFVWVCNLFKTTYRYILPCKARCSIDFFGFAVQYLDLGRKRALSEIFRVVVFFRRGEGSRTPARTHKCMTDLLPSPWISPGRLGAVEGRVRRIPSSPHRM